MRKISINNIARDSFWAVFGNGVGNALLLVSGIVIARLLGKELYGEYGVVKSTMFYIASFATLGLGVTSTKYIAYYEKTNRDNTRTIVKDSITITFVFSGIISLLLFAFAEPLAFYVNVPSLKIAFQVLAGVIVFRALTTTQIGLLAGFKKFNIIARNGILSGLCLLVICIPLTLYWGLKGAFSALIMSQLFNAVINFVSIKNYEKSLPKVVNPVSFKKQLIKFSFPVALQESSYTICHWGAILTITKLSSLGELGLYTATSQWNAIIMMIPGLLGNVILSYLSSTVNDLNKHKRTIKTMLFINFACTLVPFVIVYILSEFIASFYGETFSDMPKVLRVLAFAAIFECCSQVFKSELVALGNVWSLFMIRFCRDIALILLLYYLLLFTRGVEGAFIYAVCNVITSALFFIGLFICYRISSKHILNQNL